MLKSGRSVFALQASDFGADVAAEDLSKGVGLFAARVEFRATDAVKVGLLQRFHQVAHEFVGVLLPAVHHVLADELQTIVDEDRFDDVPRFLVRTL